MKKINLIIMLAIILLSGLATATISDYRAFYTFDNSSMVGNNTYTDVSHNGFDAQRDKAIGNYSGRFKDGVYTSTGTAILGNWTSILDSGNLNFTLGFWFYNPGVANDIVMGGGGLRFDTGSTQPTMKLVTTGTDTTFIASGLSYGTWQYITVVYNQSNSTFTSYVNGAFNKISSLGTYTIDNTNFTLGNTVSSSTSHASIFDNLIIFKRPLNSNEIQDLYTTFVVNITNPLNGTTSYSLNNTLPASFSYFNITPVNCSYSLDYGINTILSDCNSFNIPNVSYGSHTLSLIIANTTITNYSTTNTFSLYASSINMTFYEENPKTLLTYSSINIGQITNQTSSNSTVIGSVIFNTTLGLVLLRYSDNYHPERFYFINITSQNTNLSLYLINSTQYSNITLTVYDNGNNFVEGAYIKILRYFIATNTYEIVEMVKTDSSGKAIAHLQQNAEFYKFIVDYPFGTTRLVTLPSYVYSNTLNFQIQNSNYPGTSFNNTMDVSYALNFNNVTNNYVYTFNTASGLPVNTRLDIYQLTGSSKTLINTSGVYSSAGSIVIYNNPANDSTYLAQAVIITSNSTNSTALVTSLNTETPTADRFGLFGLFMVIILTLIFAMMGYYSLQVMVILVPLPLLFGSIIGLVSINPSIGIILEILAFIIAYMVRGL